MNKAVSEHIRAIKDSVTGFRTLTDVVGLVRRTIESGSKILICGNGGSAADAQHFAAELVGKYCKQRKALPAIALTTDTSILTAIANDYGYDQVFARQIEALEQEGDILITISTSGQSPNIIEAIERFKGTTIMLTGTSKSVADVTVNVESKVTARIQEVHELMLHMICEGLDE